MHVSNTISDTDATSGSNQSDWLELPASKAVGVLCLAHQQNIHVEKEAKRNGDFSIISGIVAIFPYRLYTFLFINWAILSSNPCFHCALCKRLLAGSPSARRHSLFLEREQST